MGKAFKNAAKLYGNPVFKKKKVAMSPVETSWPPTHRRKNVTQLSVRELKIIPDTVTKAQRHLEKGRFQNVMSKM